MTSVGVDLLQEPEAANGKAAKLRGTLPRLAQRVALRATQTKEMTLCGGGAKQKGRY